MCQELGARSHPNDGGVGGAGNGGSACIILQEHLELANTGGGGGSGWIMQQAGSIGWWIRNCYYKI